MWVVLYREGGVRKYETLGLLSKMSKSAAREKQAAFMSEVNAKLATAADPQVTFGQFLDGMALPFLRSKWKRSTASTTEDRMGYHLAEFRDTRLRAISLRALQAFLNRKAEGLSHSSVAHLRWDLRAVFKLALAEGFIDRDPTAALYTPKEAAVEPTRAMTGKEVEQYLSALEFRERVIAHLAIFTGMRPGEILGLQREHVSVDCRSIVIKQRLYRGDIDTPKTTSSRRTVAVPPKTADLLTEWMSLIGSRKEAWVFASENPETPIRRDNLWRRYMLPKLKPVGLEWATFQVMRRTFATLSKEAGVDAHTRSAQMGNTVDVNENEYAVASFEKKLAAVRRLESAVVQ